MLSDFTRQK